MEKNVKLEPEPDSTADKIKINYSGLLAESGAEEVYLHAGIGNQHDWEATRDIVMQPEETENIWSAELEVNQADAVNFCFKDSADNWDNNSGHNWSYDLLG